MPNLGNYCLVGPGPAVLKGPMRLPKNWGSVSGLNMLGNQDLKALGWLQFEEVDPAYDSTTHYRGTPTIDFQTEKVVYNQNLIAFTAAELTQNGKNNAKAEIDRLVTLESDRLIREIHLGHGANPGNGPVTGQPNRTAMQDLQALEDLIQAQRDIINA